MEREEAILWLEDIKNITENWSQDEAIDMAIEALKATNAENLSICGDLISRQDAIDAVMAEGRNVYTSEYANAERIIYEADAVEVLSLLPSARPTGECRTCKRSSDYSCKTDTDKTRCPIEEHYALPKDGYCHLYERAYEKMEVEHE